MRFNTIIEKARGTWSYVKSVPGKIASRTRSLTRTVSDAAYAVPTLATVDVRQVLTFLRGTLRVSAITAVGVTLFNRVWHGRGQYKRLWTDWRHNHLRLADFLWECLMVTASLVLLTIVVKYLLGALVLLVAVTAIISVALDHRALTSGQYNLLAVGKHYASMRWSVRLLGRMLITWPTRLAMYRPVWLDRLTFPAYNWFENEDGSQTGMQWGNWEMSQEHDVYGDTEEIFTTEEINDREVTFDSREINVVINVNDFEKNAFKAGQELARELLEVHGTEAALGYQKHLMHELRKGGVDDKYRVNGVRGFKQVVERERVSA